MFCIKCGAQNSKESKFCVNCGEPLVEQTDCQKIESSEMHMQQVPLSDDLSEIEVSVGSKLHCPKCKSEKIQALTETNVQGGYRAGRGCLGWLLLGPLGILCGALGKKARVSSTNNTVFVCMECGFKFPDIDDLIFEKERKVRLSLVGAMALFILCIWMLFDEFSLINLLSFMIPLACLGWHLKTKGERDELISKGYDASCSLFLPKDDKRKK